MSFDKLIKKNGTYHANILDEEGDELNCVFNFDNCVEIDVENLKYILLSQENLYILIDLIEKSENRYYKQMKKNNS